MMYPVMRKEIKTECENLIENYSIQSNKVLQGKHLSHNKIWINNLEIQKKITNDIFNIL